MVDTFGLRNWSCLYVAHLSSGLNPICIMEILFSHLETLHQQIWTIINGKWNALIKHLSEVPAGVYALQLASVQSLQVSVLLSCPSSLWQLCWQLCCRCFLNPGGVDWPTSLSRAYLLSLVTWRCSLSHSMLLWTAFVWNSVILSGVNSSKNKLGSYHSYKKKHNFSGNATWWQVHLSGLQLGHPPPPPPHSLCFFLHWLLWASILCERLLVVTVGPSLPNQYLIVHESKTLEYNRMHPGLMDSENQVFTWETVLTRWIARGLRWIKSIRNHNSDVLSASSPSQPQCRLNTI